MRILTFQARRFWWRSYSRTLDEAQEERVEETVEEAVVAFMHAGAADTSEEARARAMKHTKKHLKWLANKRGFHRIVLHSFTHLGADNASPDFARTFLDDLACRLEETGYEVRTTPFGWFCEWELAVYGESLAKVWKEI